MSPAHQPLPDLTVGAVLVPAGVRVRLWRILHRTGAEQLPQVFETVTEAEATLGD